MGPNGSTTVRWTMTLDDLVDGNRLLMGSFRRFVTSIGVAAVAVGIVLFFAVPGWLGPAAIAYGVLDLGLLWFRPIERLALRRRVSKLIGEGCEVVASQDGLAFRQSGMDGNVAWSSLTGIREDSHTLAVMSGGVARLGIPKRAFASAEEARAFRDLVAMRIASPGIAGTPS